MQAGNVLTLGKLMLGPRDKHTGLTNATLADNAIEEGFAPDGYPTSREWSAAITMRRMCEEGLYFLTSYERWVCDDENVKVVCAEVFSDVPAAIKWLLVPYIRGSVIAAEHAQGSGRHATKEVAALSIEMLDAIEAHFSDGRMFLTG